jgi:predicted esterase
MPVESHSLQTPRTARYFTQRGEGPVRRIWMLLHGHAMLAERFLSHLAPMAAPGTLLVAPEALSRFYLGTRLDGGHDQQVGATWMTRESRESEITDTVGYLDRLMREVVPPEYPECPLGVLGFSQGVATAGRWLVRGAPRPRMLALWGAPLPSDVTPALLAERMPSAESWLIAGSDDPIVPAGTLEANGRRLNECGIVTEVRRFSGGHLLHAATARALAEHFTLRTP